MNRRSFVIAAWAAAAAPRANAQASRNATLYKNPDCTCCDEYASYLRQHGFKVDVIATPELDQIKKSKGVPQQFSGCHTTLVGGYVVEGHVPLKSIERLLREKPKITGISLPGMPAGSPGMTGSKEKPFEIYEFVARSKGEPKVYAIE
jgi:hypothetical protein